MRRSCLTLIVPLLPASALAQTAPEPQPEVVVLGAGLSLPSGTAPYGSSIIDRTR